MIILIMSDDETFSELSTSDEEPIKDKVVKKKTKKDIYKNERDEVLQKLNKILGITDKNNKFYMEDINEEIEHKIMKLKKHVWEYFYGKASAVFNSKYAVKKEFLSLLKIVYKEMGYELTRVEKRIKRKDKYVYSSYYIVEKK